MDTPELEYNEKAADVGVWGPREPRFRGLPEEVCASLGPLTFYVAEIVVDIPQWCRREGQATNSWCCSSSWNAIPNNI